MADKCMIGSIFGKGMKIVKEDPNDEFKNIVICPHCGREAVYGEMTMISGVSCCRKCEMNLLGEIKNDKETDYETYVNKDYEPYGVKRKSRLI